MNLRTIFFLFLIVSVGVFSASAQTRLKSASISPVANPLKSTPAFAEVILRKTDLEADLEDLLVSYTDDFPKVKTTRYELDLINVELNKILAVNVSDSSKLTLALGKLLIRRAELQTDLWSLKIKLGDEHPDVKRAARKVAVFDKAISEILP